MIWRLKISLEKPPRTILKRQVARYTLLVTLHIKQSELLAYLKGIYWNWKQLPCKDWLTKTRSTGPFQVRSPCNRPAEAIQLPLNKPWSCCFGLSWIKGSCNINWSCSCCCTCWSGCRLPSRHSWITDQPSYGRRWPWAWKVSLSLQNWMWAPVKSGWRCPPLRCCQGCKRFCMRTGDQYSDRQGFPFPWHKSTRMGVLSILPEQLSISAVAEVRMLKKSD